ncbi:MAG: acylphosphatase [Dehalococcoidia bacterium]
MSQKANLRAVVYGLVQGVNFRSFVLHRAVELGLTGYVRNVLLDGTVEVVAEGEREKLEQLLRYLEAGPRAARVKRVNVDWSEYGGEFSRFDVRF